MKKKGRFQKEAEVMMAYLPLLILIGLVAAIVAPRVMHGSCKNTIVGEHRSPEGFHVAVVFVRDCGATTDFNTQISILPEGRDLPNDSGNAFVADTDHGKAQAAHWGGPSVNVSWRDKHHLVVTYATGTRVFRKEDSLIGVNVSYEQEGVTAGNQMH